MSEFLKELGEKVKGIIGMCSEQIINSRLNKIPSVNYQDNYYYNSSTGLWYPKENFTQENISSLLSLLSKDSSDKISYSGALYDMTSTF